MFKHIKELFKKCRADDAMTTLLDNEDFTRAFGELCENHHVLERYFLRKVNPSVFYEETEYTLPLGSGDLVFNEVYSALREIGVIKESSNSPNVYDFIEMTNTQKGLIVRFKDLT